jgi:hypothetical protein
MGMNAKAAKENAKGLGLSRVCEGNRNLLFLVNEVPQLRNTSTRISAARGTGGAIGGIAGGWSASWFRTVLSPDITFLDAHVAG